MTLRNQLIRLLDKGRQERRRRLEEALALVASRSFYGQENFSGGLRLITTIVAEHLNTDRAGICLTRGDDLISSDHYDRQADTHSYGNKVDTTVFPDFMSLLAKERCVAVDDARRDPLIANLRSSYIDRHGIGALLSAPFRIEGRLLGALYTEHVGQARHWHDDEISFLSSMSDQVGRAYEERDRALAIQSLKESENRFRALFENANEFIGLLDAEGRYIYFNSWLPKRVGKESWELIGSRLGEHTAHIDKKKLEAGLKKSNLLPMEPVRVSSAFVTIGDEKAVELDVTFTNMLEVEGVNGIVINARDVTRERQTERRVNQIQKMNVLGQLAAGIAHDVNNVLSIVSGNMTYLEDRLTGDSDAIEAVKDVQMASWRGAELTERLMRLGTERKSDRDVMDVDMALKRLQRTLEKSISSEISLLLDLHAGDSVALAQTGEFQDVIVNMCFNARDAMPDGGTLKISTSVERFTNQQQMVVGSVAPGSYIKIEVADSGTGIPPELVSRIFEPFFSTKQGRKGNGLGLAMAFGFVMSASGALDVSSAVGAGSRFTIYLPLADVSTTGANDDVATELGAELHGKKVLVVDDEPSIVKLVRRQLEKANMQVFEANNVADAIDILDAVGPVELLISDVVMPGGQDGLSLVDHALKQNLANRTVVMTGYASQLLANDAKKYPFVDNIVAKPFKKEALYKAINNA